MASSSCRPATTRKTIVIWDYDWSLINENCDTYVVKQLRPELVPLINEFYRDDSSPTWTAVMDKMMQEMFRDGVSAEQIMDTQAGVPLQPRMLEALHVASRADEMYIVSDANMMYIGAMLEKRGLRHLFKDVISHPACIDERGCMRVQQLVPPDKPHGCGLCDSHICKGKIVERLVHQSGCERVIYIGDGGGDFCACVSLKGNHNIVLARNDEHNTLNRKCRQKPVSEKRNWKGEVGIVTATVVDWTTGEDVLHALERCGLNTS